MDVKINLQDGKLVHEQKLKDRKQSVASDAASVAWYIVRSKLEAKYESESYNPKPEDVIRAWSEEGQRQWTYALVEDQKYVRDVDQKAKALVKKILYDIEHNKGKLVSLYPTPSAPAGGAGGGGGGEEGLAGLFGAKKDAVVKAASRDFRFKLDHNQDPSLRFWENFIFASLPRHDGSIFKLSLADENEEILIPGPYSGDLMDALDELRSNFASEVTKSLAKIKDGIVLFGKPKEQVDWFIHSCAHYFDVPLVASTVALHEMVSAQMEGSAWAMVSDLTKDFRSGPNSQRVRVLEVLQSLGLVIAPRIYRIAHLINESKEGSIEIEQQGEVGFYRDAVVFPQDPNLNFQNDKAPLEEDEANYCTNMSRLLNSLDIKQDLDCTLKEEILYRLGRLVALQPKMFQQLGMRDGLLESLRARYSPLYGKHFTPHLDAFEKLIQLIDAPDEEFLKAIDDKSIPGRWKAHVATLAVSTIRTKVVKERPLAWFSREPHIHGMSLLYLSREFFLASGDKDKPDSIHKMDSLLSELNSIQEPKSHATGPSAFVLHGLYETRYPYLAKEVLRDRMTGSMERISRPLQAFALSVLLDSGGQEDFDAALAFFKRSPTESPDMWAVIFERADKLKDTEFTGLVRRFVANKKTKDDLFSASIVSGDLDGSGASRFAKAFGITTEGQTKEEISKTVSDNIGSAKWSDAMYMLKMAAQFGEAANDLFSFFLDKMLRSGCPIQEAEKMFSLASARIGAAEAKRIAEEAGYSVDDRGLVDISDRIMRGDVPEDKVDNMSLAEPEVMAGYFSSLWVRDPAKTKMLVQRLSPGALAKVRPFLYGLPEQLFQKQPIPKPDVEASRSRKVIIATESTEDFVYSPDAIPARFDIWYWSKLLNTPLPKEDGQMRIFTLAKEDKPISIPASKASELNPIVSKLRSEVFSIMYQAVIKTMSEIMPEKDEQYRYSIAERCSNTLQSRFSGEPSIEEAVTTMIDGAFSTTMTKRTHSHSEESGKVLREIGKAIYPTMRQIASAINKISGEEVVYELPARVDPFYEKETVTARIPSPSRSINDERDILSLMACLTRVEGMDIDKRKAIWRLGRLFSLEPEMFEANGITPLAIRNAYQGDSGIFLIQLMEMSKLDDESFKERIGLLPDTWRPNVATLIATQNRTSLIESMPTLWYTHTVGGTYTLSKEFFLKTDQSNPENLKYVKAVMRNPEQMQLVKSSRDAINFAKHSLWVNRDITLAREMLNDQASETEAFCLLCEEGGEDDFRILAEFASRPGEDEAQAGEPRPAPRPFDRYMWAAISLNESRIKGTPLYDEIMRSEFGYRESTQLKQGIRMCSREQERKFSTTYKLTNAGERIPYLIDRGNKAVEERSETEFSVCLIGLSMMGENQQMLHLFSQAVVRWINIDLSFIEKLIKSMDMHNVTPKGLDEVLANLGYRRDGKWVEKIKTPADFVMEGSLPDEMIAELASKDPGVMAQYLSTLRGKNPQEAMRVFELIPESLKGNVLGYMQGWNPVPAPKDVEAMSRRTIKMSESPWKVLEGANGIAYLYSLLIGHSFPCDDGVMRRFRESTVSSDKVSELLSKTTWSDEDKRKLGTIESSVLDAAKQLSKKLFQDESSASDFVDMAINHTYMLPFFLEAKSHGPMGMLLVRAFGVSDETKGTIKEWARMSEPAIGYIHEFGEKLGLHVVPGDFWPRPGLTLRGAKKDVEWRTFSTEPDPSFDTHDYDESSHLPSIRHALANIDPRDPNAHDLCKTLLSSASRTLAMLPEYYEHMGIPEQDLARYRAKYPLLKEELDFLGKMRRAIHSDDAYLMELWASVYDPRHKKVIADLAATQKRMAIVMGNPTMWYNSSIDSDDEVHIYDECISDSFFELSDMKNPQNVQKVISMMDAHGYKRDVPKMIYSALIRSGSMELAKKISKPIERHRYSLEAPDVTSALIAIDASGGDADLHSDCMESLRSMIGEDGIFRTSLDVIACLPPTTQADDFLMMIRDKPDCIHYRSDLVLSSYVAGKKGFSRFSKMTGLSRSGYPIEEMMRNESSFDSESLGELVVDLEANGDSQRLVELLRMEARNSRPALLKNMLEACKRMGVEEQVSDALSEDGIEIDPAGMVKKVEFPSSHYFNRMPTDTAVIVLERLFAKDKSKAVQLFKECPPDKQSELLAYLPSPIRVYLGMPEVATGVPGLDVEATILPNGKVILARKQN